MRVLENVLHNFVTVVCSSPNIVRVIKSRRLKWAGHVARMGEERVCKGLGGETGGKETSGES